MALFSHLDTLIENGIGEVQEARNMQTIADAILKLKELIAIGNMYADYERRKALVTAGILEDSATSD